MGGMMYKIALIDDEAVVREGMGELIPWEKIGLDLIGTAEDGEQGLLLIQEKQPDVVLLDINMPKLNGLDLANLVKKSYPDMKIILISGYDEFDYARQALRMGVEDYILKPVTKSEMITLLEKVVGKLEKEREQTKKEVDVLNKIEQSIPLMQQKLLEELMFTEMEENMIIKKCIKANIPYNKKYYGVFLIDADEHLKSNKGNQKELTHFAIQNIVSEILINKNWGIVFEVDELNAVLYFVDDDKDTRQNYHSVLNYIKQAITELLGITVTIGVGTLVSETSKVYLSYDEAYHALLSRFFQGTNRIIDNIKPYQYNKVDFVKWMEWESRVIHSINQEDEFEKVMSSICIEIRKSKMNIEDIGEICGNIASVILKKFIEIDPTITEIFLEGIDIAEEIQKFKTLSDIQSWLNTLYERCYEYINSQSSPNKIHIKNIIAFIEENYNLPDLSMKMVCECAHISPSHFSNIFKKEIGMTFVQYVTEYRMEKACQLLKYTPLKTYEIAEAIGYADSHYFSTTFKKQFQTSPSEYRKRNKR